VPSQYRSRSGLNGSGCHPALTTVGMVGAVFTVEGESAAGRSLEAFPAIGRATEMSSGTRPPSLTQVVACPCSKCLYSCRPNGSGCHPWSPVTSLRLLDHL
jgi:hypothetical protein